MLMLMEASRIHSRPAAIQSVEATRHQDQRAGTENRAGQEIRTAAAQPAPGVVAGVADDGLHQQPGQRRRQPQDRDLVGARAQIFVDGAHVGHLQSPAKLNAEEPETHVPDLPEALSVVFASLRRIPLPELAIPASESSDTVLSSPPKFQGDGERFTRERNRET